MFPGYGGGGSSYVGLELGLKFGLYGSCCRKFGALPFSFDGLVKEECPSAPGLKLLVDSLGET